MAMVEPKLTKEEADTMLRHIEELLGQRLLTPEEADLFRRSIKYGRYAFVVVRASPRFITGLVAFLAACAALKAYWPFGGLS